MRASVSVSGASAEMFVSAPQVDLVGSEKLNNSMGFSMFFVGLGCLTGPPLAGEGIMSWKTFRRLTHLLTFARAGNNKGVM